jgi:cytochrome b561
MAASLPRRTAWWRRHYHLGLLLILLALVLIGWGVLRKEPEGTWNNAHFICLECIGIG